MSQGTPWPATDAYRELLEAAAACGLTLDPNVKREGEWTFPNEQVKLAFHREWSRRMRARCGFPEAQPVMAERVSPLRGTTRDESPEERQRYTNKAYRDAPTLQAMAVQALGTAPEEAMSADAVVVALGLPRSASTTNQVQARLAVAARRGEVRRRQDRRAGRGPKVCWAYWRVAA